MVEGVAAWNTSLIRRVFWRHDEEAVMRVKITGRNHVDTLAWKHEKTGLFSVRSATRSTAARDGVGATGL